MKELLRQQLIVPEQVPRWAPGQLTVRSPTEGWDRVSVRGYRYTGSDVEIPPIRDYVIVAYRRGSTTMRRRLDHAWSTEHLEPGDVSLLTRATHSHWVWPDNLDVVHVYLTKDELSTICHQMYERDVQDVELHDKVKADDPAIYRTAMLLAYEATQGDTGSKIMVDSLSCQLAVHILRKHAHVLFRERGGSDGLNFQQDRAVRDYVHHHLGETISLDDLASAAGLSRFHFARRFRRTAGITPHEFVMRQRVERARTLLLRTNTPLVDIAALCGFADQSHFTREFRKRVGETPGRFRSAGR
ncbi:Transcriptional activator [Candidatus Protofrankia californiensis]|uniref:Transcriptional activator n=1 Tax=Candidatus Protofrankia californiensis TaxID=1839754 RepID=A0A1C3NZG1_9ACTN|nr:Transcriptional activator [Candidatus Protofrankia californiensis]